MSQSPERDVERERRALVTLTLAKGLGPIRIANLLDHFGTASRAVDASVKELAEVERIGTVLSREFHSAMRDVDVDAECAKVEEAGVSLLCIFEPEYPGLLRCIPDPPPVLYLRGAVDPVRDALMVAVVGSRKCTAYGREQAARFAAGLAQSGFTIVSGGARGIDTQTHYGALRAGGRTIVVLGCGLSHVYPSENTKLFDEIVDGERGAVLSEFPMDTAPIAENFPRRNRIISGLSLGTVVIEASTRSGALITARLACEDHNREVMALPGRVDSETSEGCLRMLKEGWARIVTAPTDVLEGLEESRHLLAQSQGRPPGAGDAEIPDWRRPPVVESDSTTVKSTGETTTPLFAEQNLTDSQMRILQEIDAHGRDVIELDELAARTGIAISQLQADVTMLQIRGLVGRTPSSGVERRSSSP